MTGIRDHLGVHANALMLREKRNEVLASNIPMPLHRSSKRATLILPKSLSERQVTAHCVRRINNILEHMRQRLRECYIVIRLILHWMAILSNWQSNRCSFQKIP